MSQYQPWWTADKGMVCKRVHSYVRAVEDEQSSLFDRFVKLNALYDPNAFNSAFSGPNDQLGIVQENVIASNVDTVAAVVSATDVVAAFETEEADWETQKRARDLGYFTEQLKIDLNVLDACRAGFKLGGALKGTAINKVYINEFDEVCVERRIVDNVIVDEAECEGGAAHKQMHFRMYVDRDELKARFPGYEVEIDRMPKSDDRRRGTIARKHDLNSVCVLESIRLPTGRKGHKGYKAGRRVISIPDADLHDEPWHKPHFGCSVMVWSKREDGFYGIGGAERIAGHQRALNKRNWQIDATLDRSAVPVTYVRTADANLSVKTVNRLGSIAVIKGDPPVTIAGPAVHAETYQSRIDLKASAFEEFGMSMLTAQAKKPAGIDSGVAMREYRDQTTQRFALQEKAFEKFVLDTLLLVLDCCKDLGSKAPAIMKRSRYGVRKIEWSDVDMSDLKVQIQAASQLAKTPAGRKQFALELAQAGVISTDEYRRLLKHPDIERAMSVYTAALEAIEEDFDTIADGKIVMPEPFGDLAMMVWRGEAQYMLWRNRAPEEILEALRSYIVNAAWMQAQGSQNKQPMPGDMAAEAGAMPMDPAMAMDPTMAMPAGMAAAPGGTPAAALSPQAMSVLPS